MAGYYCKRTSNVACNFSTFNSEEIKHYNQFRTELMTNLTVEEISCGYALLYPNQSSFIMNMAEWMVYENRCCPFLNISLFVSGEAENIKVELSGNETAKKFLKEEFNLT